MNTELVKQEALIITERIRANGRIAASALFEMCKDLRKMKVENLYTHLGYENFEDYAEQEFNIKRRQAYQYISVYENLGEDFVQSNAQLGITKLSLLTQIDLTDRNEIMENNELGGMTVNEIKDLIDKVKVQGEQLSMFEMERQAFTEQADADKLTLEELRERLETLSFENEQLKKETDDQIKTLQREKEELADEVRELESRPVDVAVSEPEIKEVIKEIVKEVPDKKAIADKDREIKTLKNKYKALDEARKEEVDKLKASYESRITELEKAAEKSVNSEKNSFKALYADAYKSFSGLIEFIKVSAEQDKELYIDKSKQLLDVLGKALQEI